MLILPIKKKWFDMILSGKCMEYEECIEECLTYEFCHSNAESEG